MGEFLEGKRRAVPHGECGLAGGKGGIREDEQTASKYMKRFSPPPAMRERPTKTMRLRESTPRRTGKKCRVPKEKGVWGARSGDKDLEFSRRKGQIFFPLHSLVLVSYTTQFKLCTRDYTTTMYPAGGQSSPPENLLTNPDILACKLWEWVW